MYRWKKKNYFLLIDFVLSSFIWWFDSNIDIFDIIDDIDNIDNIFIIEIEKGEEFVSEDHVDGSSNKEKYYQCSTASRSWCRY